ncbi:hypothetical protein ABK040_002665 [Willaertia magna]
MTISHNCKHGKFFCPPFEEGGCSLCRERAEQRFRAAKLNQFNYKLIKSNPFQTYQFLEEETEVKSKKGCLNPGDKVSITFWIKEDQSDKQIDENIRLLGENSLPSILANGFSDLKEETTKEEMGIALTERIATFGNEFWSLLFHLHSLEELFQFVKDEILKEEEKPKVEEVKPSFEKKEISEKELPIITESSSDKNNVEVFSQPTFESNLDEDFNDFYDHSQLLKTLITSGNNNTGSSFDISNMSEDEIICFMMYGTEGLEMMRANDKSSRK